jgi:colicin import membrane protein
MLEAKRTLVKSPPELWEIVDDPELMGRMSVELFGSHAIEVVERWPGRRLAWRVSGRPEARVELALAEKGWGTQVAIRVGDQGGRGEELAGAMLDGLLDQLGSAQRPLAAWRSGSAINREDGEPARGGIEATIKATDRSASNRTSASAERRSVGESEEGASLERGNAASQAAAETSGIECVNVRSRAAAAEHRKQRGAEGATAPLDAGLADRSLEKLAQLIMRRAAEQTERARRAAEDRLAEAGERLRSEAEQADRRAWARIEEADRGLSGDERQRQAALARAERDRRIRAAERRLARQATEIFARLEREAGRLQERARRAAAARAAKEVDRRLERSVESALRDIEGKLIASMRGDVAEKVVREFETAARNEAPGERPPLRPALEGAVNRRARSEKGVEASPYGGRLT